MNGCQPALTERVIRLNDATPDDVHELLFELSANLARASATEIRAAILDALRTIGENMGVDRAYMFTLRENQETLDNVLEWRRSGIPGLQPRNRSVPLARYPWLRNQLGQCRCLAIDDVTALPEDARTEKAELKSQQVCSRIVMPLRHGDQLYGLIGFDTVRAQCQWPEQLQHDLSLIAEIIGGTLHRQSASLEAAQFASRVQKLMQPLPGLLFQYQIDSTGAPRMPFICERFERFFGIPAATLKSSAHPLLNRIHGSDYDRVMSAIRDSWESTSPFHEEFRVYASGGGLHWFEGIAIPEKLRDSTVWHGYLSEITNQMASEQAIIDQGLWTQAILDNVDDAIFSIDEQGIIQSANRAAERTFGYRAERLKGSNINRIMPEPHRSKHDDHIERYLRSGEAGVMGTPRELEAQRKDGSVFPIELRVSRITMNERQYFIGVVRDISQRKHSEEQIRDLAYYDPLTGLPNRRLVIDRIQEELGSSVKEQATSAILFLDLDNFKNLNDSHGHSMGDRYLVQVARRLEGSLSHTDTVARIGGDEFVALVTGLDPDPEKAKPRIERIADEIRQALAAPFQLATHEYIGSFSIGATLSHRHTETVEDLLKQADIALHQAKKEGKNTVRLFSLSMQQEVEEKLQLEGAIRNALRQQHFELHYQPQVSAGGRVSSVEALLRWHHPQQGWIPPGRFIPACEETGLILDLGEWVVETACRQLALWSREDSTSQLVVAINISARQFHQPDFVEQVLNAIERTGAPAHLLELELTESLLVQDMVDVIDKMNELREHGVRFSLDDFGTGYSSLAYLKRLPLNQLKIDISFVRDILSDDSDIEIARMIVALATAMELEVIAEGVETREQCQALSGIGCYRYQGFLFARPVPVDCIHDVIDASAQWEALGSEPPPGRHLPG